MEGSFVLDIKGDGVEFFGTLFDEFYVLTFVVVVLTACDFVADLAHEAGLQDLLPFVSLHEVYEDHEEFVDVLLDFDVDFFVAVEFHGFDEVVGVDAAHGGEGEGGEEVGELVEGVFGVDVDDVGVGEEVLEVGVLVELLQEGVDVAGGSEVFET